MNDHSILDELVTKRDACAAANNFPLGSGQFIHLSTRIGIGERICALPAEHGMYRFDQWEFATAHAADDGNRASDDWKGHNTIICGFPGIGKSYAEAKRKDVIDAESSAFHYTFDPDTCERKENPEWPTNYLDYIEKHFYEDYRQIILTSTHEDVVLSLLNNRELPIIVVVPEATLRNEYMIRYLKRGSDPEFIYSMYNNWLGYIEKTHRLVTNDGKKVPIISLKSGQYLSDVLPMY